MRKWIATSIGLALLVGGTAQGQTSKDVYPNRPVRMIVPFGAGGPGDIFARLIGQKLSEQLGQQFVIENRPGAGGNIGAGVAARAPADAYTLTGRKFDAMGQSRLRRSEPHDGTCPLRPESGQTGRRLGTSALCQNQTLAVVTNTPKWRVSVMSTFCGWKPQPEIFLRRNLDRRPTQSA